MIQMGEPIKYLTEDTYRPKWFKEGVTELTLKAIETLKPEIIRAGKELAKAGRFYLIGSGASNSAQFPIRYITEKYTEISVYQYSGWEFLERMPPVRNGDVCIFISHTGKTRELIKGLEWAKSVGAATVGVTQQSDSPINRLTDIGFSYSGRSGLGKLSILYVLFGTILKQRNHEVGSKMLQIVESLPSTLTSIIPSAKEAGKALGLRYKDDNEMFVVGGGINWGLAYEFATSFLQELCWVHATPVNYSEFTHGPIELFTPGRAAIFLLGHGGEEELEKKVVEWSVNNGVRAIVFDSQGLSVDNLMTPFTLNMDFLWFVYYLSLARNRDMDSWRYYDKVEW
jgi:fructoselysine-6-P-deglycase FrlB-like protein